MSNPEIKTIQLDGCRFYKIRDQYYPSVTSILSIKENYYLERWIRSLPPDKVKEIQNYTSIRGECIHYLVLKEYETDTISQGDSPNEAIDIANENEQMLGEIWKAVDLLKEFQTKYILEPVALEKAVWNHEYKYAGRVDGLFYLVDEKNNSKTPILVDLKTSKMIYQESTSMQLSAYNFALNNWATELYVLLLHPGKTKINRISVGADKPYWQFTQVENSFPVFTYYEALFRPKAHQILQSHGFY